MSRGRKRARRKTKCEYSMCGDTLLVRCDAGTHVRVTAVMPEWMLVSIGDVAVEWEDGTLRIRDVARGEVLFEQPVRGAR
jgi:hypothetical protein